MFRESLYIIFVVSILYIVVNIKSRKQIVLGNTPVIEQPLALVSKKINLYVEKNLGKCFNSLKGKESDLTRAIVSVEYISLDWVEYIFEYSIVIICKYLHLKLPDFSYGVSQLRPSTIKKYNQDFQYNEFIIDCRNISLSHKIIKLLLIKYKNTTPHNTRILKVIREYTGQTTLKLEHRIHNAIIIQIFNNYKNIRESKNMSI